MRKLLALAFAGALCVGQALAAPSASLVDETLPGAPPIGANGKPLPVTCVSGCSGGGGGGGGAGGTVTQGPANDGTSPWNVKVASPVVIQWNASAISTSNPLPTTTTNGALEAGGNLDKIFARLDAINAKLNGLGQKTSAQSAPVVLPSDQTVGVLDSQLHQDLQNYAITTGTKAAPPSSGIPLLGIPLPWVTSTTLEACKRFKVGSGILYRIKITLGTGSGSQPTGFLKLYDASAIPADGTDTPQVVDLVGSNGVVGAGDDDMGFTPMSFSNGLVACFSTTGGFTKTSQSTPATLFSAQVQ